MHKLRHMSLFMSIVEAGSITHAADKLNLSKSVLSQHLKQLESDLSITLLKRTTRRQSLTPAGEKFYRHCCQMHQVAEQAWSEVLQQQQVPSGRITVTAPHALMNSLVVPALADAFAAHDQVALNLICEDGRLDLMQHDIDLAIRVGDSPDSNYRQKRLGHFNEVLCQRQGAEVDLETVPYVANHWQTEPIRHELSDGVHTFTARHRTNTMQQTVALIEAGLGIGLVPEPMLREHPKLAVIAVVGQANVYALHPYATALPLVVSLAQRAIAACLDVPP